MGEYWKSLPRKFCDICKCWFADNKASIQFHESGKRHQENAQKRIQDIQKRGIKDAKKQKQMDDDMAKIEKAALAAYKKDLESRGEVLQLPESPDVVTDSNHGNNDGKSTDIHLPAKPVKKKKIKVETPSQVKEEESVPQKIWYEAMSDEGYKYYWNTENAESTWDPPKEGYVSLEKQKEAESKDESMWDPPKEEYVSLEKQKEAESKEAIQENCEAPVKTLPIKKEIRKRPSSVVGPQPKVDPYGQWVTIEHKPIEHIDLQLPKAPEDEVEVVIPVAKDEPKLKFREKVVGQLPGTDPTEEVIFKKRKFGSAQKRNVRQRFTDDD